MPLAQGLPAWARGGSPTSRKDTTVDEMATVRKDDLHLIMSVAGAKNWDMEDNPDIAQAWRRLTEAKDGPEPAANPAEADSLSPGERDAIRADLGELLEVTGLGDHARPEPPHQVFQQALTAVRSIRAERDALLEEAERLRRGCGEHPGIPGYRHPGCGFCWHGRDGLDVPLDGNREPRCPRCALAELENAITWGTSCLSCATVLDSCARETERAEKAEADRDQAASLVPGPGDVVVDRGFMRSILHDAIRACESDAAAGDPEAPDFLAEYRDEFARLSAAVEEVPG